MKFSSKEDIEAPIGAVFDMVSDFAAVERGAGRRGIDVRRTAPIDSPMLGLRWDAAFDMRGRRRNVALTLSRFDPPICFSVEGVSQGMTGIFNVELLALSRTRTRLAVDLELKPRTISARLLIQSLRLARARLTKRFKLRVAQHAKDLEDRYKRIA